MTSMTNRTFFGLGLPVILALGAGACGGGPSRTQTTHTTSVERPESGGEVHRDSTETLEVAGDGSQSTNRTESTQTTTPAGGQP